MKNITRFLVLFFLFITINMDAQTITGDWYGALEIQGMQLRLVFHITEENNQYVTTMDSPDQEALAIPVEKTIFDFPDISLTMPQISFEYSGAVNHAFTEIEGEVVQFGNRFPVRLKRQVIEKKEITRPQEPTQPYPYHSEDVSFVNLQGEHTLAGTLTLPTRPGKHPVVVLISGSGPQNRNEELMGHKPFLVLADHLTRQGIGVLRYDDRGVGESTGDFSTATSFDFSTDAEAAMLYLKTRADVDPQRIGLMGHSEGGMIAPMVAPRTALDYIVLLAGPGIPIKRLMALQQERIGAAQGTSETLLQFNKKTMKHLSKVLAKKRSAVDTRDKLSRCLSKSYDKLPSSDIKAIGDKDVFINMQLDQMLSPWFRYFINYKPAEYLKQVTCPVLALNGQKDLQVTATENIRGIEHALDKGQKPLYTTRILEDLNHLFQHCETGNPSEYSEIEETFSVEAMELISQWILEQ